MKSRGGARATAGRKPMGDATRVNLVLDASSRAVLDRRAGKSQRAAYVRTAIANALAALADGENLPVITITPPIRTFAFKAPRRLLSAASAYCGTERRFASLSEFVRTALGLQYGEYEAEQKQARPTPTPGSIITIAGEVFDERGDLLPVGLDVVVLEAHDDGSILVWAENEAEQEVSAWLHPGEWA